MEYGGLFPRAFGDIFVWFVGLIPLAREGEPFDLVQSPVAAGDTPLYGAPWCFSYLWLGFQSATENDLRIENCLELIVEGGLLVEAFPELLMKFSVN